MQDQSLGWDDPLEGMSSHSSILAWTVANPMDSGA